MGFLQDKAQAFAPGGAGPMLEGDFDKTFGRAMLPAPVDAIGAPVDVSGVDTSLGPIAGDIPGQQNFFQKLGFGENRRGSVVDVIGRIADSVAQVGGVTPQYRQNLDADTEAKREQAKLDWMEKFNQQKLQAGSNELETFDRSRIGDALAAVASSENPAATWAQIANATGIAPEKAEQLGALFTQNPIMASQLAKAFGYSPPQAGSAPREIQLYQEALKENRDLKFTDFLQKLESTKDAITPYQQAQLERVTGNDRYTRGRNARVDALRERQVAAQEQRAVASGTSTGGVEMTKQQRGNINMKLRTLPAVERQLAEVERLAGPVEKSLASGFLGGMVPGNIAGGDEDAYDKAVANLRTQIRQLTRTPGEGSISDYETRLNSLTLPERTSTPQGRAQAISDMRALIGEIRTGYQEMIGTPKAAAPAAASPGRKAPPPRRSGGGGGATRLKYNPATGRIE